MARLLPPDEIPSEDDAALAVAAQAGDRAAFEALVRRHQRAVLGLALRVLGPGEDARDAAQEIFVKTYLSLDRYDPARPFAPWLMTVARNGLRDRLRRQKVRRRLTPVQAPSYDAPGLDPLDRVPDRTPDAEASLSERQARAALESALQRLPVHYREVIELHHVQERPVKEIAEIIGRPQGTVMTWLYRARSALKSALSAEGGES